MREQWDQRYTGDEFFYGTAPNSYVASQLKNLPGGHGLFLAEGEGRNAVYAATLGHKVTAVDFSLEGQKKALALAERHGVMITYQLGDVSEFAWDDVVYDFAVLCFMHLPPAVRWDVHRRVVGCLRSGGLLVLESFARAQFGRPSGGPPSLELLHDLAELQREFPGMEWSEATELEVELDEGRGHAGLAAVNRLVGKKTMA